eukprot:452164-Prorocentrum_minimum.AAC.1
MAGRQSTPGLVDNTDTVESTVKPYQAFSSLSREFDPPADSFRATYVRTAALKIHTIHNSPADSFRRPISCPCRALQERVARRENIPTLPASDWSVGRSPTVHVRRRRRTRNGWEENLISGRESRIEFRVASPLIIRCTTRLEDASGVLRFGVSVPRLRSASTLDRHFPCGACCRNKRSVRWVDADDERGDGAYASGGGALEVHLPPPNPPHARDIPPPLQKRTRRRRRRR